MSSPSSFGRFGYTDSLKRLGSPWEVRSVRGVVVFPLIPDGGVLRVTGGYKIDSVSKEPYTY